MTTTPTRHEQIKFEAACLDFVRRIYNDSPIVSTSHKVLRALNANYGEQRVANFTGPLIRYIDNVNAGTQSPRLYCADWDSQDNTPHLLIDPVSLVAHGQLWPVDYELVQNSAGIQNWSKRNAG